MKAKVGCSVGSGVGGAGESRRKVGGKPLEEWVSGSGIIIRSLSTAGDDAVNVGRSKEAGGL